MLGYVTIDKGELKLREYEVYQAYYCGICKALGKRWGEASRLNLSYDSVFLAVLLSSLEEGKEDIERQRCILHPVQKRPVALRQKAVDYAADVMVILAYHKFVDDWKDEHSLLGLTGKTALRKAYRKLAASYPGICRQVEEGLQKLTQLEQGCCDSLDLTANAFADVMEPLFTGYFSSSEDVSRQRILGQMGRALGRWIYVIDALDDLEKDEKKGRYNPLLYRHRSPEEVEALLYHYLTELMNAYDLLKIEKNNSILENIIFLGLRQRTDHILKERKEKNAESI